MDAAGADLTILSDPEENFAWDMLLADIFSHFPITQTGTLASVSLRWCRVAEDNSWKPELILYSWGDSVSAGHGQNTTGAASAQGGRGRRSRDFLSSPKILQCFYSPRPEAQITQVAVGDFYCLDVSRPRPWSI